MMKIKDYLEIAPIKSPRIQPLYGVALRIDHVGQKAGLQCTLFSDEINRMR